MNNKFIKSSLLLALASTFTTPTWSFTTTQQALPIPSLIPAVSCATRLVSVVAHVDDDLLFINPQIMKDFDNGACINTVHLIGGSSGGDMNWVCTREEGLRKAYARMANLPDVWTVEDIVFAGKYVTRMTLNANPNVKLFEVRLPGGDVRGSAPLQNFWDLPGQTITSQSGNAPAHPTCDKGIANNTFNRDELKATLLSILQTQKATKLSTLNPDTTPWLEHPDHIYAARLTRETAKSLSANIPISYYETYPSSARPFNVLGQELQRKRDIAAAYFTVGELGIFTEHHWNGNWVGRSYQWTGHVHDVRPDWQARPFELANVLTTQCLTSAGVDSAPYLSACTGTANQKWIYRPIAGVGPGNKNNAQLVSSSNNCIAYDGNSFAEVTCASNNNQSWTPWDFGLVRAPHWMGGDGDNSDNNCLSVNSGSSLTTSAACNTAASRWAPTSDSTFHDLRQENALVDDFTGDGNADLVIVQRASTASYSQADKNFDAGFNVFLKNQTNSAFYLETWYQGSVPVSFGAGDQNPCAADSQCFDSSRFLSGDFDGDGKYSDLMVISPYQGGTGFWLLQSDGTQLKNPILWKQTSAIWTPALAQQYVSGDFAGDNKTDVLIAHHRSDKGLNLWVLTSNGTTGNDPQLWYQGIEMSASANLKSAKLQTTSAKSDLLSFENGKPTLKIRRLINAGSAFTSLGVNSFKPLEYLSSKPIVTDTNTDGLSDVIILHKRSDGPDINVWQMLNTNGLSLPSFQGTINHSAWADQIPYAMARKSQSPLLAMVARPNANYIPSEEGSQTTNYWRLGGANLYTHTFNGGVIDTIGTDQGELFSLLTPMYFQDILHVERLCK